MHPLRCGTAWFQPEHDFPILTLQKRKRQQDQQEQTDMKTLHKSDFSMPSDGVSFISRSENLIFGSSNLASVRIEWDYDFSSEEDCALSHSDRRLVAVVVVVVLFMVMVVEVVVVVPRSSRLVLVVVILA
jgi:hypothetical protein